MNQRYVFEQNVTEKQLHNHINTPLWKEIMEYVVFAIWVSLAMMVVYVGAKETLFRSFAVDGQSMAPNYGQNDIVFVNKIAKRFGDIQRGDVVVFREQDETCPTSTPVNGCYLIKRVIGLPGETIGLENGNVYVYNDQFSGGIQLDESAYLPSFTRTYSDGVGKKDRKIYDPVPANSYFVMGDNRNRSNDSRFEGIGFITLQEIEGKEMYRPNRGFFQLPRYNISNQ